MLTKQALERIRMYRLVRDGVATYQQLGVPTPRGAYPIFILKEHLMIDGFFAEAREQKAQMDRMKSTR